MTGNRMKDRETGWGGVTRSKGPQVRLEPPGHCSEDKASAHGMPTLPSELMSAPSPEGIYQVSSSGTTKGFILSTFSYGQQIKVHFKG